MDKISVREIIKDFENKDMTIRVIFNDSSIAHLSYNTLLNNEILNRDYYVANWNRIGDKCTIYLDTDYEVINNG